MSVKRIWKDYNLSIVLATMFLFSWVGQTWTGWREFQAEQKAHAETAEWFGDSGYVWKWSQATLENWQSEFLQLLTFVVLTTYLVHRGSHESKDTDDEMMAMLKRIEHRLKQLEVAGAGESAGGSRVRKRA
jgi:hypothetical protein